MATGSGRPTNLLVLADGVQTALVAGAVAELERSGRSWKRVAGAGLGAQVAALAALGEAREAERRWLREAELGCPLLDSQLASAQRRLGPTPGVLALADPWTMAGWLDSACLAEHLAPEAAGLPERLARSGNRCAVALHDLATGRCGWRELDGLTAAGAGAALAAAAAFPAGWGPSADREAAGGAVWGGVGLIAALPAPWSGDDGDWDVVCGFPVPPVKRPAIGGSLLESIQRRDECLAASAVERWLTGDDRRAAVAPDAASWAAFAARDSADLGVEYPLAWERNGELARLLVGFGAFVARRRLAGSKT